MRAVSQRWLHQGSSMSPMRTCSWASVIVDEVAMSLSLVWCDILVCMRGNHELLQGHGRAESRSLGMSGDLVMQHGPSHDGSSQIRWVDACSCNAALCKRLSGARFWRFSSNLLISVFRQAVENSCPESFTHAPSHEFPRTVHSTPLVSINMAWSSTAHTNQTLTGIR
jgi:hypothetical protein